MLFRKLAQVREASGMFYSRESQRIMLILRIERSRKSVLVENFGLNDKLLKFVKKQIRISSSFALRI